MGIELSSDIKSLIDRPNFAHLATLMSDGSPQSVPVKVGREDDQVLICTGESSLKARNTLRDQRVALSIVDLHNPYEEVQLRGRAWWSGGQIETSTTWTRSRRSTRASLFRFAIPKAEWR